MYNNLFSFGPFTVHGYGLMIAIGVIAALYIAEYRAPKNGMDKEVIFGLTMYCVFTGILGAKILYCITNWKDFIKAPLDYLGSSGLVVYGGIIGGVLCAIVYCRFKKLKFWDCFDIALPSVAVAQAFGRLGCFMAGCCYGKETKAWYGIAFAHSEYCDNLKRIPTQLISSAGMFMIAFFLFWYAYHAKKAGQVGAAYMILYSIGRFCVEFLRGDLERGQVGTVSTSQFISFFIVVAGVAIWILRNKSDDLRIQAINGGKKDDAKKEQEEVEQTEKEKVEKQG